MRKLHFFMAALALLFASLFVNSSTAHAHQRSGACKVAGVTYKVHTIRHSRNYPIQVVASSNGRGKKAGYDISVKLFERNVRTGRHVQTANTLNDRTRNPDVKTWQASGGKIRPALKPYYQVYMGPYRKAAQCQFRISAV